MKKLLSFSFIAVIITLVSCNTQPAVVYSTQPQVVAQQVVAQPVVAQQNYQVITDPYSGTQDVVYVMNGIQYSMPLRILQNGLLLK